MNKIQVMLVLIVVLAFGGAMAQADAKQAVLHPALVLPQGVELSDEELSTTMGEGIKLPVGGAIIGATGGVSEQVAQNIREGRSLTHGVAGAAATGAISGAVAGGQIVKTVVERIGRHLWVAYRAVDFEAVARAAGAGALSGWLAW